MKSIEEGIKDKEVTTKDIRSLVKLSEDHYKLTITNEGQRTVTIKEFNKKQLKEIYSEVKQNISNLRSMYLEESAKAKVLNNLDDSEQEKIEDFIHMMNLVKDFSEAEKAKIALPNIFKQIDFLAVGQKEIELALPEVLRNK